MTVRPFNKSIPRCVVYAMVGAIWFTACQPSEKADVHPPDWSRNASIYEVNLRQYSSTGDLAGFREHLPRLKELGVDILWFMPIHPIGEQNRKGSLGSYYSVQDYLAVDPNVGTMEEFKSLVGKIHALGMHVIIDWVANHTSWDNPLAENHPEWYTRDATGAFMPPVPDWSDVIDLDYDQPGLWDYQIDAMSYWLKETDIDGFRCDVAGMVPLKFWQRARAALDKIKPVFMLAEAEGPQFHHNAFDMTYAWNLHHLMTKLATGARPVSAIDSLLQAEKKAYPAAGFRMQFTSNHDENSWNGTVSERLDAGAEAFAVLACTVPGMPLIYSGQEAGLDKRLDFFERDPIVWRDHKMAHVYQILLKLKQGNDALDNAIGTNEYRRIAVANQAVFAFLRQADEAKVLVVLNLSGKSESVNLQLEPWPPDFKDIFSGAPATAAALDGVEFGPWEYMVLAN